MISMSWKHTVWSIVFSLVILLFLAVMPAQAQEQELGSGCNSDAVWMCYAHHVFLPGVTK